MSHYLNIYIKKVPNSWDSEEKKKEIEALEPIMVATYGGSSDIYRTFVDNNATTYGEGYRELNIEDINIVIEDTEKDIKSVKRRIAAYEGLHSLSDDQFSDLLSAKEYFDNLNDLKKEIDWIIKLRNHGDFVGYKVLTNYD